MAAGAWVDRGAPRAGEAQAEIAASQGPRARPGGQGLEQRVRLAQVARRGDGDGEIEAAAGGREHPSSDRKRVSVEDVLGGETDRQICVAAFSIGQLKQDEVHVAAVRAQDKLRASVVRGNLDPPGPSGK